MEAVIPRNKYNYIGTKFTITQLLMDTPPPQGLDEYGVPIVEPLQTIPFQRHKSWQTLMFFPASK